MKKALAILTLLHLPLSLAKGALIANVVTDKGTIVVELQYTKAPKAVANFMTMAQATRARLDPVTGEVIKKPLYVGEKFFRVENTASFKIIQTGSGNGNSSGVPGFTFKDEFDPTLTHVPYVLSMANAGPNTNSGQIFFTGNSTIAGLNNVHTVFGLIPGASSRAVIDAILAAGANATTITAVTFQKTDGPDQAFDELAQGLPTVSVPDGSLAVQPGVSATWNFATPLGAGSIFRAFRSNTFAAASWTELTSAKRNVGLGPVASPPSLASVPLDAAPAPKAFYRMSVANHPGSVAPSTLANRTVSVTIQGGDFDGSTFAYAFNATGAGGTFTYTPAGGGGGSALFSTVDPNTGALAPPFSLGGHDIIFDAHCPAFQLRELLYKIGCDSATSTTISGRANCQFFNGVTFSAVGSGTATITR